MIRVRDRIKPALMGSLLASIFVTGFASPQSRPFDRLSPVIHKKPVGLQTTGQRAIMASQLSGSASVTWGPAIKISDDPIDSGSGAGSFRADLTAQGETLHCTFFGGNELLQYLRYTSTWTGYWQMLTHPTLYDD
jgi:hypothetical protein